MPQFDQFSFLNQILWFYIFFFCFYFIITYFFIPSICYNIKFRKKKILFNNKNKNQINFEKSTIFFFFNNFLKKLSFNFHCLIKNKKNIYIENNNIFIKNNSLINTIFEQKINNFLKKRFFILNKFFIY